MRARILSSGSPVALADPRGARGGCPQGTDSPSWSASREPPRGAAAPPSPHRTTGDPRRRRRRQRETLPATTALAALPFLSRPRDPGDWDFSPEWYGSQGGGFGRDDGVVVYESGDVTVTGHPSSSSAGDGEGGGAAAEWRVLRFGQATRQSVSLVSSSSSSSLLDPTCLAFEYTKTLVALSLALLPLPGSSRKEEAGEEEEGRRTKICCVGVGGGSVPAALARLRPDADVSAFEVDERVVGSWPAMGLVGDEASSSSSSSSAAPSPAQKNLRLERRCGAEAVAAVAASAPGSLDLLVVDAFDARDAVPALFTEPGSPFLADAARALGPRGAALINLHCGPRPGPAAALAAMFSLGGSGGSGGGGLSSSSVAFEADRGQGREAVAVARAYAAALLDSPSSSSSSSSSPDSAASAFLVAARRQQNAIGVVARAGLVALLRAEGEEGGREEGGGEKNNDPASSSSSPPSPPAPPPRPPVVDASSLSAAASRGAAACAVTLPFEVGSRANFGLLKLL